MARQSELRDLESQLCWCWHWYSLRLWQDCGSPESVSEFDRFQIAQEMLADSKDRTKEWAAIGLSNLIGHLMERLDDPDLLIRQEAAVALGDICPKGHAAIDVLIRRLRSAEQTPHDRGCAAWALGQIGARAAEVIPILLAVIEGTKDQCEADDLRHCAADAIEKLTGELGVLVILARNCLSDRFWKCRLSGLFLAERLLKREPELCSAFAPVIEPLVEDEVEEIRANACRILNGS